MKSVITEAKLTKRFNTGEYQHEEYTLTAAVDSKESGDYVLRELKLQINEAFKDEVSMPVVAEEIEEPKKKKGKKENVKAKPSVVDNEDEGTEDPTEEVDSDEAEGTSDDEASNGEDGDIDHDSTDDSEGGEESEEDSEDDKPVAKAKSGKGGKAQKAKPQNYDREVEQHRDFFSKVLRSVAPDWSKSEESKARAKKVSVAMAGKPFLDIDGEILDSFKAEVKKLMAVKKGK